MLVEEQPDLRFGFARLPPSAPGYLPAVDARALMLPGLPSPARDSVPGVQYTGSYAPAGRFVLRVPAVWNGSLIVAGTPATRCEFSNDCIWGDFALARGYAFAASNKGVPYNAIVDAADRISDRTLAYPVPFNSGGLLAQNAALQFGMLSPQRVPIEAWNADFHDLTVRVRELLTEHHAAPHRVFAVGLSNGGAQVRTLLERYPELVDGGVECAGVYWTPDANVLDDLPPFLAEMPGYIGADFADVTVVDRLQKFGFPPDVRQHDPAHPSLYAEYYSNVPPFYADVTVFAYALLIDPLAQAGFDLPACVANAANPDRLPATCNGSGLARPENRASYVPSAQARRAVNAFAHTGSIGKPLISLAGTHDVFITPERHAVRYAQAVAGAGCGALHELLLVAGGTHVDAFAAYGYGLVAQAPFAWAAFDRLVRTVESGAALGGIRIVVTPGDVA